MANPDSIVYVVDDDASIRAGLESLLCSAGVAVRRCASGYELLARPSCNASARLVLDVHLPEGSELELQRELASGEPLPIVFITGHGDIPMSRPFRNQELIEAVKQALRKARANWNAHLELRFYDPGLNRSRPVNERY